MLAKSTPLHLDNYQTTEHSHLLQHRPLEAIGQTQHRLCKKSLCFKKNACTVTKVFPLTPRHPQRHDLLNTRFLTNPRPLRGGGPSPSQPGKGKGLHTLISPKEQLKMKTPLSRTQSRFSNPSSTTFPFAKRPD